VPGALRQGAIVWSTATDPNGVVKRRPLVIITADAEIAVRDRIAAVAITTTFAEPPPADHVPLPWDPTGRSATRLRRRSAAVPGWVVSMATAELEPTGGYVPAAVLLQVLDKLPKP
jgi:mRNA-degrading endonuclease toxin of MazEF toxin-antitoxin module